MKSNDSNDNQIMDNPYLPNAVQDYEKSTSKANDIVHL